MSSLRPNSLYVNGDASMNGNLYVGKITDLSFISGTILPTHSIINYNNLTYVVYTFAPSTTTSITITKTVSVHFVLVGGSGNDGGQNGTTYVGGGGGSGGLVTGTFVSDGTSITITVGNYGSTVGSAIGSPGSNGTASSISFNGTGTVTANGGGGGSFNQNGGASGGGGGTTYNTSSLTDIQLRNGTDGGPGGQYNNSSYGYGGTLTYNVLGTNYTVSGSSSNNNNDNPSPGTCILYYVTNSLVVSGAITGYSLTSDSIIHSFNSFNTQLLAIGVVNNDGTNSIQKSLICDIFLKYTNNHYFLYSTNCHINFVSISLIYTGITNGASYDNGNKNITYGVNYLRTAGFNNGFEYPDIYFFNNGTTAQVPFRFMAWGSNTSTFF
jgi:hypothetical protein